MGPDDLISALVTEAGISPGEVRNVEMRERHSFVEVPKEKAAAIVEKMKRVPLMGKRLKVKLAKPA